MAKRFEKLLVLAVIFTMTIVNYGMPLQAIASEGESLFNFAFFRRNEISLDACFGDDSDKQEEIVEVNDTAQITFEVTPLIEGYLKSGSLKLYMKNGNENNFRVQSVMIEEKEEIEVDEVDSTLFEDKNENEVSNNETSTNNVPENKVEDSVDGVENKDEENKNPLLDLLKNTTSEVLVDDAKSQSLSDVIGNTEINEEIVGTKVEEKEEAISEDEKVEDDVEIDIEKIRGTYEVHLENENEIVLKNIIDSTKIFIEVAYKQSDNIDPKDLYSEIEVVLEGNYINKKLETIDVTRKQELVLGWEYSKEIQVTSDFVKVSPFTVGENYGTIVENIITVSRNIEESNYLPIKETNIKIEIPKINDKLPIAVNVSANKLMTTVGKELTGREFTKDNWSFDAESGILEIDISNKYLLSGNGEDKLDIICRYEDYISDEKIILDKKVEVRI